MLKALLWDVDGTLAETERDGHLVAFNLAFEALRVPWRWDEQRYGQLLAVTGGRERLLHDMQVQPLAPAGDEERFALAGSLHRLKNEHYARIVAGAGIPLRDGVLELMDDCLHDGILMGIVTTTSRANVQALLQAHLGSDWRRRFEVIVCGEDAPLKKPQPQAYRMALQALALASRHVLAIEDSPAGVAAARAAGVSVVVTRSHFFAAPVVDGALAIGPSLGSGAGWTPQPDGKQVGIRDAPKPGEAAPDAAMPDVAKPGLEMLGVAGARHRRIGLDQLRRWHQGAQRRGEAGAAPSAKWRPRAHLAE